MSHDHHHHKSSSNLKIAFFLNVSFTIAEIVGGILVNSVAILSDAVHDLGDSLSLGLAWYLNNKSKQKADKKYSFGYARFSLLGALINSIVLIIGSVFVVREAIERFISPEFADPNGMLIFAILGVVVNGYAALKVKKGNSLNEKVISWHLLEDVLGWSAILVAALVLKFKFIWWLDPALSIGITFYILYGVISRLKETLHLFLQGVPKELEIQEVEHQILKIDGIESIHQTNIWSLDGENHVFSTHLKLSSNDCGDMQTIKKEVKAILKDIGFQQFTVELEMNNEKCEFE
ncbi:MAG: cation transporter [Flavobacteriales bacterium]|nr:cation transporter [Flavobacteriales bacterium]MCB9198329.1 cation transporter [Flavobacteriales bacterium]